MKNWIQLDLFNPIDGQPQPHTYKVVDADTVMFDDTKLKWFFSFNFHKVNKKKLISLANKKCRHCWLYGFIGGNGFAQNCEPFLCHRKNGDCGYFSIHEFPKNQ